jgi:hypothetical protein
MTTLNFLECKRSNKTGKVALIEVGKEGELCGASRWTMAYLRLDKDNNFDTDWIKEMDLVSNGLADSEYCKKMGIRVPTMAYVSQNRYSTALDPFLEFAVHLGVYGKDCPGPPF